MFNRNARLRRLNWLAATVFLFSWCGPATAQQATTQEKATASKDDVDFGSVRESHVMIPMRDGKHLSAYLYFPDDKGPWPAVFEQRYASLRGKSTREAAARLSAAGFVVALVNFRGTQLSEARMLGIVRCSGESCRTVMTLVSGLQLKIGARARSARSAVPKADMRKTISRSLSRPIWFVST